MNKDKNKPNLSPNETIDPFIDNETTYPPKIDPLPILTYFIFSAASFANGWSLSVMNFFQQPYLLNVAFVSAYHCSILFLLAQVWNAFTDIIIAFLSDRTKTRLGRRRPWILGASPFFALSFFLFFQSFPIKNDVGKFIFYLSQYFVFYVAQTAFNVPHCAMVVEMAEDANIRNKLVSFRMAVYMAGTLIGTVSQSLLDARLDKKDAYSYGSIIGAVCIIITLLITGFFAKEDKNLKQNPNFRSLKHVFKSVLEVLKIRAYLVLTFAYGFSSLALQIVQNNFRNYVRYSCGIEDWSSILLGVILLSGIFFSIILSYSISYFGKRPTYVGGLCSFIIVFIALFFLPPRRPYISLFLCFLGGCGTATTFLVIECMLPDVIDSDYIKTGKPRQAVFYSIFIFFQKACTGIGLMICGQFLDHSGYINGAKIQPESVNMALRYIIAVPSSFFIILSFVVLYFYPIDEETVLLNKKLLAEKRSNEKLSF